MAKDPHPITVNVEEGQVLLRVGAHFTLPEKLGDTSFNVAERSLAAKDVAGVYALLKKESPLLQEDRRLCFGPEDAWEKSDASNGADNWKMRSGGKEKVDLKLDEDHLSGCYWIMLLCLHPASPIVLNVSSQCEVGWPLARKLRLIRKLEKAIGLDKAEHKRLDLDPLDGEEEVEAEPKKEEAKK